MQSVDMEEIFQELILSVGLSVAVCYMIMKFRSHGDEENAEKCIDGVERKEVSHDQKRGEQAVVHDIGKSRRVWPLGEFFENLSVENIYVENFISGREITSEVVDEDAKVLQLGFSKEIESVSSKVSEHIDIVMAAELKRRENIVGGEDGFKDEAADESFKGSDLCEIEGESAKADEERLERSNFCEIESEDVGARKGNFEMILSEDCGKEKERDVLEEEEDKRVLEDWEGIERTELEKLFGAAVAFVGSKSNAGLIDRDLKIQLYGLHKVAIEGPCQGSKPIAFKVSARAKWNSWQTLGNMNREDAMEQYLTLLSKSIPDWIVNDTSVKQCLTTSC